MGKVLMIGAGGVATVAAFKIAQNADVFTDFMIASRTKAKCDRIVEAIGNPNIKTAQVDADDVEQLKALFNDYKPELVINLALPYQDLTIMEACLACGCSYLDTANYEPKDAAPVEYSRQWADKKHLELMPPSITSTRFSISTSSTATQETTTRLSLPTSTLKSISARSLRRVSTGKTESGWRPSRSKSTSRSHILR